MKLATIVGFTALSMSYNALACTPSGSWSFNGPRLAQAEKSYEYTVKVPAADFFQREKIEIYVNKQLHATEKTIPIKQTRDFTLNFPYEGRSTIEVYKVSDFNCGSINVDVRPNVKQNVKIKKTKLGSETYPNGVSVTRWRFDASKLGAYAYQPGTVEMKWFTPVQTFRDGRTEVTYRYAGSGPKLDFTAEKLRNNEGNWVRLEFVYKENNERIAETLVSSYYVESDVWCDPHGVEFCQITP